MPIIIYRVKLYRLMTEVYITKMETLEGNLLKMREVFDPGT